MSESSEDDVYEEEPLSCDPEAPLEELRPSDIDDTWLAKNGQRGILAKGQIGILDMYARLAKAQNTTPSPSATGQ